MVKVLIMLMMVVMLMSGCGKDIDGSYTAVDDSEKILEIEGKKVLFTNVGNPKTGKIDGEVIKWEDGTETKYEVIGSKIRIEDYTFSKDD